MRPGSHSGLRHVALTVDDLDACVAFYTELLGMHIEWHPDADNVYLTSGNDNLALHRRHAQGEGFTGEQRLDHIGFIIDDKSEVDTWHRFLKENEVRIVKPPKTHRDGARSFYCLDPDGNMVQIIHHPPIAVKSDKSSSS